MDIEKIKRFVEKHPRSMSVLLVCVLLSIVVVALTNQDFILESFKGTHNKFDFPAQAKVDGEGNVYVIDRGLSRLTSMNSEGIVQYRIESGTWEEYIKIYNSIADDEGNLYIYAQEIDPEKFRIKKDFIKKYDKRGKFIQDIYHMDYNKESVFEVKQPMAVPQIASLECNNGIITFSRVEENKIILYMYNIKNDSLSDFVFTNNVEDYSITRLSLLDFEHYIWTTQYGKIYEVDGGGKKPVLRGDFTWTDEDGGIIPWFLKYGEGNEIVFYNMADGMILRLKDDNVVEDAVPRHFLEGLESRSNPLSLFSFGYKDAQFSGVRGDIVWHYDGNDFRSWEGFRENAGDGIKKIFLWFLVLLGVLLLVATVHIMYKYLYKQHHTLLITHAIILFPMIVISYIILYNILMEKGNERMQDWIYDDMLSFVSSNAEGIDGDLIESIDSIEEFKNASYTQLNNDVKRISGKNNRRHPWDRAYVSEKGEDVSVWASRFYAIIYKFKQYDDAYKLYVLSQSSNDAYPLLFGYTIDKDSKEYKLFKNGASYVDVSPSVEGLLGVAGAPIYNSRQEIAGVLEVGFDFKQIELNNRTQRNQTIATVTFFCVIMALLYTLLTFTITRRLSRIFTALNEIKNGNFNTRIKIMNNDEIGDVGNGLNDMADKLQAKLGVEKLSRAKTHFIAGMSHEIRTPMNAIIGFSELMPTENFSEVQKKYLYDISSMAKTLLGIINNILDFSNLESGKVELVPVHFEFKPLCDEVCSMFAFTASAKSLRFTHTFNDDLPAAVYGDANRVRQILINVINNAIKYTRIGGVDLRIDKEGTGKGKDCMVIEVADSGIGIKKDDMAKLFSVYDRIDNNKNRKILGTGLGLAITKQLLDLMGGSIGVTSDYLKGSCFTIKIPLVAGDVHKIKSDDIKDFYVQKKGAEVNILVVDDSQVNLTVTKSHLANHYMKADTCNNGKEALAAVCAKQYDMVFMDQMMPEMDGLEATKAIRELGITGGSEYEWLASMPIVALTANAVSEMKHEFLSAGMNDCILKPIDASQFNRVLVKFLPPEKTVKGAPAINSNPVPGEYETYWSEAQRAAYRELAVVKRLDVKAGMGYAADSIEDYFNVLRQFCKELPEAAGVVRADVGEGNWKDYALRLHSYKGTLAMMGCAALSADAKALEGASKAGGDENILFCKKETPAFLAGLEQFGADLRGTSLFKIDVKEKTLVDMADVRARLRALFQTCADLKSADALAIAADVKGFRLAEEVAGLDAKLEEVCALVSSFRFSEACAKIAGLL